MEKNVIEKLNQIMKKKPHEMSLGDFAAVEDIIDTETESKSLLDASKLLTKSVDPHKYISEENAHHLQGLIAEIIQLYSHK